MRLRDSRDHKLPKPHSSYSHYYCQALALCFSAEPHLWGIWPYLIGDRGLCQALWFRITLRDFSLSPGLLYSPCTFKRENLDRKKFQEQVWKSREAFDYCLFLWPYPRLHPPAEWPGDWPSCSHVKTLFHKSRGESLNTYLPSPEESTHVIWGEHFLN